MKNYKGEKKNILKVILILFIITAVGFCVYYFYGLYKMNQLSEMTFQEMLAYTTKDNQEVVITVGIIKNDEMSYEVYGENGNCITSRRAYL